jgi:hypothetical protein
MFTNRAGFVKTHRQVEVDGIEVDEGMADMLRAVWKSGINTQFSCQGNEGATDAYGGMIVFPTVTDAVAFMSTTLDMTGYSGCYSPRLIMEMAAPVIFRAGRRRPIDGGPVRSIVRWPSAFTPIWTAAWLGSPISPDEALAAARSVTDKSCAPSVTEAIA